jgi:glutathione S-transferase
VKIFHLATEEAWTSALAAGTYTVSTLGMALAEVGFIHCSQAEQVTGVHERFYRDVAAPLVLLTIDTDLLTAPWQLDPVDGEPMPFPHIYGPLNVDAVVSAEPFRPSTST